MGVLWPTGAALERKETFWVRFLGFYKIKISKVNLKLEKLCAGFHEAAEIWTSSNLTKAVQASWTEHRSRQRNRRWVHLKVRCCVKAIMPNRSAQRFEQNWAIFKHNSQQLRIWFCCWIINETINEAFFDQTRLIKVLQTNFSMIHNISS